MTGVMVSKPGSGYLVGNDLTVKAADIPNKANGGASNADLKLRLTAVLVRRLTVGGSFRTAGLAMTCMVDAQCPPRSPPGWGRAA